MTPDEIRDVLDRHLKWLGSSGGEPPDLREANLRGANLRGAKLSWADLSGANLSGANLLGADLREADLRGANPSGADLSWANLSKANLSGANLRGANLRGADLIWANLSGAFGVLCLPVGDPRGYRAIAVWAGGQWIVSAGCRWFTVRHARDHWGAAYEGARAIGDGYLAALDWLEQQPTPDCEAIAKEEACP